MSLAEENELERQIRVLRRAKSKVQTQGLKDQMESHLQILYQELDTKRTNRLSKEKSGTIPGG